jgi:hypothetical protein
MYRSSAFDPIQAKLADVMTRCMTWRAENRPDIFQVIDWLKDFQRSVGNMTTAVQAAFT